MKMYEVKLEYGYSLTVSVQAEGREEARRKAKENAVLGIEISYDDKLVDDMTMPFCVDSMVYDVED